MGSSSSKIQVGVYGDLEVNSSDGRVLLSHDANESFSLRGNAYVRIPQQDVGKNKQSEGMFAVTATLIGEERTCVAYEMVETYSSGGRTYHRTRTCYARSSNKFLSTKLNLYNGMGGVDTDLHLPFEFLLPNRSQGIALPSTMSDPFRSRDSASVEYYVLLQVQLFGNQRYEHRIPFVVTNSPPPKKGPITVPPTTEVINCCFCCGKGTVTAVAFSPLGTYGSGDTVSVGFDVVNDSVIDIDSVVLRVKEKGWWTASGRDTTNERTFAEYTLIGTFMPGLTAKNSKSETIKMEHYIDIEFHTGALYTNMHMRCPITVYKKLPQVLPRILSLSPHGPHNPIQTAQLAHIPIGNPALPLPSAPPLPPGWNPTVAPLTAATAPSEPVKPVKQAPVLGTTQMQPPPLEMPTMPPSAPAGEDLGSETKDLVRTLEQSSNPVGDTREWVTRGGGRHISARDLGAILGALKEDQRWRQVLVARELMQVAEKAITCDHAVEAAQATLGDTRADIVRELAPHILDPQNAAPRLIPNLSSFAWIQVEYLFRQAGSEASICSFNTAVPLPTQACFTLKSDNIAHIKGGVDEVELVPDGPLTYEVPKLKDIDY